MAVVDGKELKEVYIYCFSDSEKDIDIKKGDNITIIDNDIPLELNCRIADIKTNSENNLESTVYIDNIEIIDNEIPKEDNSRYLKLTDSEILWLSNLMCSEIDGTEASHSLYEKIDRLYQEVFNNKVGDK